MRDIETMSLREIERLNNPKIENWYHEMVDSLNRNRITETVIDKYYGRSVLEIEQRIELEELKYTSELYFPGEIILMYPGIREHKAKKYITCDFSSAIISPGNIYIAYRPLVRSLSDGEAYVLKRTLKVENGYAFDLPSNISEFEDFVTRAEAGRYDESRIDYNHLLTSTGGVLEFQKLKRR